MSTSHTTRDAGARRSIRSAWISHGWPMNPVPDPRPRVGWAPPVRSDLLRAACVFAASFVAILAHAQDRWTAFPQNATRENLWSIASGARTLVVAGERGTIISYDYDDQAWLPRVSGTAVWLVGAGFGAGRFIVVGDQGTILTSDDAGITWTPRASGTTIRLNAVAYGNNRWLAVGEQGVVLTSADGTTWTSRPSLGTGFLRALAYGQGRFLIGGARGVLFSTTDAIAFTPVATATTSDIESVAISAGHFWLAGSGGLRASATQLGNWQYYFSFTSATFRGVTVRNADEASAVGESTADAFTLVPTPGWSGYFEAPHFLATAVVQGVDEVVCVGFGGSIAHSLMNSPAVIISDAGNYTSYGSEVHLRVVSGQPPLSLQWRRDGVDLPGATQSELILPRVTLADAGQYDVRVTPANGALTSITGAVSLRLIPAGRPEVRDLNFAPALPSLPFAAVRQPDGKTLVAGSFAVTTAGGPTYGLARLNPDGSVDPNFRAGDGVPGTQSIDAIRLLADGRIYVRGTFSAIAGQARAGVARLMANGALDTAFVPDPAVTSPRGLLLASDGRLYLENTAANSTTTVMRLNADGSLDASFPKLADNKLIGIDSQGRLLAVASASGASATLVRYLTAGTRDPAYTASNAAYSPVGWGTIFLNTRLADTGLYYMSSFIGGHFGSVMTFAHLLPDGGFDPGYNPPPQSDYPASAPFAAVHRPDGGLWQVRSAESSMIFRAWSYAPDGTPDANRYATLPDFSNYYILNIADDGSMLAYDYRSTGGASVNFFRVRPFAGRPGRLTNLSVRAFAAAGSDPLIAGFVTTGTGATRALVRGIGPTLRSFGVNDAMRDPSLALMRDNLVQASNDNWPAALAPRFASVGAFALTAGSADAALEADIGAGNYTGVVTPAAGESGTALVELFDSSGNDAPSRRFVNVSARGRVEPGHALIVGFTIAGDVPATVLVRGIGPALTGFGVSGALADPRLTLYRGEAAIWENTRWQSNQAPGVTPVTAAARAGAFALDNLKNDTAMVVTLAPGSYTATVTSQANAAGTALVEVYEVP